jgi:hypothetical protein
MAWDPLPDHLWQPTVRSLHRWSEVVGKFRLKLAAGRATAQGHAPNQSPVPRLS